MAEQALRRRKKSPLSSDSAWAYVFVAPQMLGVAVFVLIPVCFAFYLSLCNWNLVSAPQFIGLDNFRKVLNNKIFWQVLRNTGYSALLYIPSVAVVSLSLAILLNKAFPGVVAVRTITYLPHLTCSVAACMVWAMLYQSDGLINSVLGVFGIIGPKWLTTTKWAMPAVVIVNVWLNMGHHMLLYLAGLKGINPTYYEAARIDGANSWQLFGHVTLPMLTPTIFFTLCTSLINSLQEFNSVYMLTQGGPSRATQTMVYKVYTIAFQDLQFGRSATWALLLFVVILAVTFLQFRMQKYWVNYDV